ncbi:Stp1/IreP family PP2C-type Ser/Thr phosphatase [Marinicrinis lubricantis]|uniref:Stp1/IreP family PP2C-type Ser/Thr phosphatase n=1 Tax=Marinicrinis lubricantis TaxID=2086470 RepID=A0ABW1IMN9_9BACL
MRAVSKSDVGKIRSVNEDRSLVVLDMNGLTLAVVADGMGGHQAGEVASEEAIRTLEKQLSASQIRPDMPMDRMEQTLIRAMEEANRTVFQQSQNNSELLGMGTTMVAVLADHVSWMIGHVGDSRAYKLTDDALEQITEDHSLVNELLKRGQITMEEAVNHPRKNVLTRALGTDSTVTIDTYWGTWNEGDYLLICSDGLSNLVNEEQMLSIVKSESPLEEKADLLVKQAMDAGGDDNITVVLLENLLNGEVKEG